MFVLAYHLILFYAWIELNVDDLIAPFQLLLNEKATIHMDCSIPWDLVEGLLSVTKNLHRTQFITAYEVLTVVPCMDIGG